MFAQCLRHRLDLSTGPFLRLVLPVGVCYTETYVREKEKARVTRDCDVKRIRWRPSGGLRSAFALKKRR